MYSLFLLFSFQKDHGTLFIENFSNKNKGVHDESLIDNKSRYKSQGASTKIRIKKEIINKDDSH